MGNKLFLMIEDNEAIVECKNNLYISILPYHNNFDDSELIHEDSSLSPMFKAHIEIQGCKDIGSYDLSMEDLELFAKTILSQIEALKYYKSNVLHERIKKGYCL